MTDGNDDTGADSPEDGGVLDPDDLDIRGREEVDERGEGRYVISTDAGGKGIDSEAPGERAGAPAGDPNGGRADDADQRPHLDALAAELEELSAPYGLALAGAADGDAASIQFAGGDPADVLGAAVRWYARRVDPEGDPDATAAELLASARVRSGSE